MYCLLQSFLDMLFLSEAVAAVPFAALRGGLVQVPCFGNQTRLNLPLKAEMFRYTLHVPAASLEPKTESILIRRGRTGVSLLVYLFLTGNILKLTSDTLSEILTQEKIKLPKNSTKRAKITALLKAPMIQENIPEETRISIEKKLDEDEANRKNKKTNNQAQDGYDNDDEQVAGLHIVLKTKCILRLSDYQYFSK